MPGDETRQKTHDGSDSESEDEDVVDTVPKVDIDPSKLTPLSPEVISKQVRNSPRYLPGDRLNTHCFNLHRQQSTWVRGPVAIGSE